ncbi:MAG: D-alanine--D-alanine ligase family protein [Flavobacteriales bacterium]
MENLNIALVTGGYSAEREISIKSAKNVFSAIENRYSNVFWIELNSPKEWICKYQNKSYPIDKNDFNFSIDNQKIKIDFALVILHGTPAEDGLLSAYFDLIELPYSCCNSLASQVTFNKASTIRFAKALDIPCANSVEFSKSDFDENETYNFKLKYPLFVKACRSGSSFGVQKVHQASELNTALKSALEFDNQLLIEEGLGGLELTCGVFETEKGIQAIAVTEIQTDQDFFDYEAKYEGKSQEITPARISDYVQKQVEALSKSIYKNFDLSGVCRVDYMIGKTELYLIEINTIPGLTNESFIPQQVAYRGWDLGAFFEEIIRFSMQQKS